MESLYANLGETLRGGHVLSMVIFLPVMAAALLFTRTAWDAAAIRRWALGVSLVTLLLAAWACGLFLAERRDAGPGGLCLVERLDWISPPADDGAGRVKIQYLVGVDGISLPLLLLTAFLTPLAIWGSFTGIQDRHREYYSLMLLLHGAMLGVFCARDLLLFYIFFEFTLIPLYFLIGVWGGSQRRKAADMFFIYTLSGSMLTFAAVLYLGWKASVSLGVFSLAFDDLYALAAQGYLPANVQWWLFLAFFAGFAIKVPLFPLHTWLPLAHTEAPTAGSVILAAILLKLGTYGFLRLSLPLLPGASVAMAPFVGVLAVVGIIYGALAAWVQGDVKKLVAYSSVSHLGFCLLGMFSLKTAGLTGSLFYMINHGLSTGALFLVVGMIYERYHTRQIDQLGGLGRKMPVMAFFLLVFTLSSIGLPGLNGFVGEFLVLLGTFTSAQPDAFGHAGRLGVWFAVPAATGVLLGAIYMLHMVRGIVFGPVKEPGHGFDSSTGLTQDLTRREIGVLAPIAVVCLLLGVYPKLATSVMEPALEDAVLARVFEGRDWRQAAAESAGRDAVAFAGASSGSVSSGVLDDWTGRPVAPVSPASVSPASVSPASVSPASVSPASVSPASVSPASVAPKSVSPESGRPVSVRLTSGSPASVRPAPIGEEQPEASVVHAARVERGENREAANDFGEAAEAAMQEPTEGASRRGRAG